VVCRGPAGGGDRACFSCRTVAQRLGAPPSPVVPAFACPAPGPLYAVLLGYKEAPVDEARRHFARVVRGVLDEFLAVHAPCVAAAAGGATELVLPVPSTRRPGPPALGRVEGLAEVVAARLGGACWDPALLRRTDRPIGHMQPHRDAFAVAARRQVAGSRVALVDDVYVSGARAQSAASALRGAGAASVVIVVLGRVLRPERVARHARFLGVPGAPPVWRGRTGADPCGRCVRPQARVSTE